MLSVGCLRDCGEKVGGVAVSQIPGCVGLTTTTDTSLSFLEHGSVAGEK